MSLPNASHSYFAATGLPRVAKAIKDVAQGRRPSGLVQIYDGGTRSNAARLDEIRLHTVRDLILALILMKLCARSRKMHRYHWTGHLITASHISQRLRSSLEALAGPTHSFALDRAIHQPLRMTNQHNQSLARAATQVVAEQGYR